jgi:hypothetical protein
VNVVGDVTGDTTLAGYSAIPAPNATLYFPNTTRTLGGAQGWTTPLYLQNAGTVDTSVTLEWRRFSDQQLALTESVPVAAGVSVIVDPRNRNLQDNTQYAVKATTISTSQPQGTPIAGIVMEINYGDGDGANAYEGFAPIAADPVATGLTRISGRLQTYQGFAAKDVCIQLGPGGGCITRSASDGSFAYEVNSSSQVNWTFHYIVNGVEKGNQLIAGPFTVSEKVLATFTLTQ